MRLKEIACDFFCNKHLCLLRQVTRIRTIHSTFLYFVHNAGLSHLRLEESTAGGFFCIKRLRLMRQVSNPAAKDV
jgi:hypothetical protein